MILGWSHEAFKIGCWFLYSKNEISNIFFISFMYLFHWTVTNSANICCVLSLSSYCRCPAAVQTCNAHVHYIWLCIYLIDILLSECTLNYSTWICYLSIQLVELTKCTKLNLRICIRGFRHSWLHLVSCFKIKITNMSLFWSAKVEIAIKKKVSFLDACALLLDYKCTNLLNSIDNGIGHHNLSSNFWYFYI